MDEWLDHGEWSPGGFPPDAIEPGKTGTWHAQSAGVMTGVQGHVTYRILDKSGVPGGPAEDHYFGTYPNNHTGLEGCFQFVFDNPYAGAPSVDKPTVSPCAGSFESGDPSNDYKFSWAGVRKLT